MVAAASTIELDFLLLRLQLFYVMEHSPGDDS